MCWCSIAGSPPLDERAPRLLFVPVSGAFGMGEYARSLAIAQGAQSRWPCAAIRFMLSRAAPYAAGTPFPATLLASSPTFHSAAVIGLIEEWRPDVVIFDNAGRTSQLRAAKRCGARVVYISARRRQRNKAFRLSWMRLIDEHWIAYPKFIAGDLRCSERLKLRWLRRPQVRYLDVILARGGHVNRDHGQPPGPARAPIGATPLSYVLVVPGGGTGHPGASDAVAKFRDAARALAAAGTDTVFVGPPPGAGAGSSADASRLRPLGILPQAELAELMRGALFIITNGGSTLLQALACGKPCLAVPIAADQRERIDRCVAAGVTVSVPLDSSAIVNVATQLLRDEARLSALAGRTIALGLADGIEVALRALAMLLEPLQ